MALPAYVLDSCSLIHLERTSDLTRLPAGQARTFVPYRVAKEVNLPRTRLSTWLRNHSRIVTQFVREEGRLYLEFVRDGLDDGEAAALAVAANRAATLVSDDKAARRMAESKRVRCIGTATYMGEVVPEQGRLV